jgi:hypothetical protein
MGILATSLRRDDGLLSWNVTSGRKCRSVTVMDGLWVAGWFKRGDVCIADRHDCALSSPTTTDTPIKNQREIFSSTRHHLRRQRSASSIN